ncbi:hypothetical protein OAT84_01615 [Gammaproteobacteria bacterium]|nr:hypothetical protein [Gammaproteobacteria bacterium]
MEFKKALLATCLFVGSTVCANAEQDKYPASYQEYLQSISLAGEKVSIEVPSDFDLAAQEINPNQQTLGFVHDGESIANWNEYVSVNISFHTDMSVRTRLSMVEEHLKRSYGDVRVISTDFDNISKNGRSYQVAKATFLFTDEQGPVTTAAVCYSDFKTLVGTQVSLRGQHSKKTSKSANRLAKRIISIQ